MMYVHLVFVAKSRRRVFDGDAQLIEVDGEEDHVHLSVEYPPKAAVSSLVNSLKGVSSRLATKATARHPETLLEGHAALAVLLCLILWWYANTSNSSRSHCETQGRLRRLRYPFPP